MCKCPRYNGIPCDNCPDEGMGGDDVPKPFDTKKPVRTQQGSPARIICIDAQDGSHKYGVALVQVYDGAERIVHFKLFTGKSTYPAVDDPNYNLVNVEPEEWVNIWRRPNGGIHSSPRPYATKELALHGAYVRRKGLPQLRLGYITTIRIT